MYANRLPCVLSIALQSTGITRQALLRLREVENDREHTWNDTGQKHDVHDCEKREPPILITRLQQFREALLLHGMRFDNEYNVWTTEQGSEDPSDNRAHGFYEPGSNGIELDTVVPLHDKGSYCQGIRLALCSPESVFIVEATATNFSANIMN